MGGEWGAVGVGVGEGGEVVDVWVGICKCSGVFRLGLDGIWMTWIDLVNV